ncbi:MAG: hypothetical protein V3U45_03775 [bacterium]
MVFDITVVGEEAHYLGDLKGRIVDIDVTSYTTGGETVTPANWGFTRVDHISPITTEVLDHLADWLPATNRFRIKLVSTGAELASTGNGGTFRVLVVGK